MARWRKALFAFLSRNARPATQFFHLPPNRVVEIGALRGETTVRMLDDLGLKSVSSSNQLGLPEPGQNRQRSLDDLCERVLRSLRAEVVIHGHDVVVGASIGVAVADADDDAAGLLRNADMAMYRAKAAGGGVRRFMAQMLAGRGQANAASGAGPAVAHVRAAPRDASS